MHEPAIYGATVYVYKKNIKLETIQIMLLIAEGIHGNIDNGRYSNMQRH